MADLFTTLTHAVEGSAATALAAALAWGVLSVMLSPCHLAGIPLIIGYISSGGPTSPRRAAWIATVFATGILLTIALIGLVTAAIGRMAGDVGPWGNRFVAVIFLAMGLHLMGVLPLPWQGNGPGVTKRRGAAAAFLLGLTFGVALGPCTFAYMAPMLGVTFRLAASDLPYGILLLAMYGIGHCAVIVIAGTLTGMVQRYLDWNERSRGALWLRRGCGLLVVAAGFYML